MLLGVGDLAALGHWQLCSSCCLQVGRKVHVLLSAFGLFAHRAFQSPLRLEGSSPCPQRCGAEPWERLSLGAATSREVLSFGFLLCFLGQADRSEYF